VATGQPVLLRADGIRYGGSATDSTRGDGIALAMRLASQGLGHDFRTAVRNVVSPATSEMSRGSSRARFRTRRGENRLTRVL